MPIYEYFCMKCEKSFSVLVMSVDANVTGCPSCGSEEVKKLISSFSCSAPSDASSGGSFPVGGT